MPLEVRFKKGTKSKAGQPTLHTVGFAGDVCLTKTKSILDRHPDAILGLTQEYYQEERKNFLEQGG